MKIASNSMLYKNNEFVLVLK